MGIPFKVSTTTSNFMIGVTAAASAGVYPEPRICRSGSHYAGRAGSASGLLAGARMLARTKTQQLRWVFAAVIVALGGEMLYGAFAGKI